MYNNRRYTPDLSNVGYYDKEEMFKIISDELDGSRYYDLTDDIIIDVDTIDPSRYTLHTVSIGETPYSLSYKYYNTTQLWWVILVFNGIEDPFEIARSSGMVLKIPDDSLMSDIVNALKYK